MSFLEKMLASVGIGAAKVDTRIPAGPIRAGEELRGVVVLRGGNVEQRIEGITLTLGTRYVREVDDHRVHETAAIARFDVPFEGTIGAGEEREIPFSFVLPEATPVTAWGTPVWLKTGLAIDNAFDASDSDRIEVAPHRHAQPVLEAIDQMGFRLRKVDCEYSPRFGRGVPFVQEFEYRPSARFLRRLDELEVVLLPHVAGCEVLMEVDRRARGLSGMLAAALGTDERLVRLDLARADLERGASHVAQILSPVIERFSR